MREIMYTKALAEAQLEELRRDKNAVLLGLDLAGSGSALMQTHGIFEELGKNQVIDTPISESGYTGVAVGLAMGGIHTIVEIQFADFAAYAFDAIVNQAAKLRFLTNGKVSIPLVVRLPQGNGLYFGAQHQQCVEGWFQNVPGLKIVMPATPYDAKGLLKTAIRDEDPVLFLESKQCLFLTGEVPDEEYTIPFGQANVAREGTDVTIVAIQSMLAPSLSVAEELAEQGISVEVVDPRTIIPLDRETLVSSAKKTGRVVVAHESPVRGGIGAEISAVITEGAFSELKAPVSRVGALNIPIPFGPAEEFVLPDENKIEAAVLALMERK